MLSKAEEMREMREIGEMRELRSEWYHTPKGETEVEVEVEK